MFKGYKIKIYPTEVQKEKLINFCHAARFAYNWTIARQEENYKNGGKFLSAYTLQKEFTQFRKDKLWTKEISRRVFNQEISNACENYLKFFKGISNRPKFKKRNKCKMSFTVRELHFYLEKKRVKCEKIDWINIKNHNIPIGDYQYQSIKIVYDKDDFWLCLCIDLPDNYFIINNKEKSQPIGVDLGIKKLAVCSNKQVFKKPNVKKYNKRIRRLSRRVSKHYKNILKTKNKSNKIEYKSKNLLKLESKIRKDYRRINNILTTNIHTITKTLIKENPKNIVIENLSVRNMMKNKYLSSKLMEAKFYEFRRQLEYKCKWYGVDLIIADRWYPSSKICSCCGNKKKILKLSERTYKCEKCGLIIDRDYNAALNLRNLAL